MKKLLLQKPKRNTNSLKIKRLNLNQRVHLNSKSYIFKNTYNNTSKYSFQNRKMTTFIPRDKMEEIGERMKGIERESLLYSRIEPNSSYIIRADGSRFSSFTKGFKKPVDERIRTSMVKTAADLCLRFAASSAYTASDEISLIFPPSKIKNRITKETQPHIFGGRVMKISTSVSSLTSARFNFYLSKYQTNHNLEKNNNNFKNKKSFENFESFGILDKISSGLAYFDARPTILSTEEDLLENILWRIGDIRRNSVTILARSYLSHKTIEGLSNEKMIALLKEKKNIDWEKLSPLHTSGSLIKKRLIWKETSLPQEIFDKLKKKKQKEKLKKETNNLSNENNNPNQDLSNNNLKKSERETEITENGKVRVFRNEFVEIPANFLGTNLKFSDVGLRLLTCAHITEEEFPEIYKEAIPIFD